MKKFIPAFGFLLLAAPCFATLYWSGDNASGSITNMDNLLWSCDATIQGQHYVFQPQYFTVLSENPLILVDVPLISDSGVTGDFNFNESSNKWAFSFGTDNIDEERGNITSVFRRDVSPTPEPSSFILMGSAILALWSFRKWSCRRS